MRVTIEAGRLACGVVREACERTKFYYGNQIDWWESGGLFRRTFVIAGQDAPVQEVVKLLEKAGFNNRIDYTGP